MAVLSGPVDRLLLRWRQSPGRWNFGARFRPVSLCRRGRRSRQVRVDQIDRPRRRDGSEQELTIFGRCAPSPGAGSVPVLPPNDAPAGFPSVMGWCSNNGWLRRSWRTPPRSRDLLLSAVRIVGVLRVFNTSSSMLHRLDGMACKSGSQGPPVAHSVRARERALRLRSRHHAEAPRDIVANRRMFGLRGRNAASPRVAWVVPSL